MRAPSPTLLNSPHNPSNTNLHPVFIFLFRKQASKIK